MKKFRFQLETLLKVTRMKKDQAEVAFAEASKRLTEARDRLTELMQEMQQGHHDYDELAKGKITLGTLMAYNSFFDWKRQQIEQQQHVIVEANAERQKKLKLLMEIMAKLKSIKQLKEKRLQEYKAELLHEEQKMLDEIGSQLYTRGHRKEDEH